MTMDRFVAYKERAESTLAEADETSSNDDRMELLIRANLYATLALLEKSEVLR